MIQKNPKIYSPTPKIRQKREFSFSQTILLIFYLLILGGAIYFLFFSQVFEITQIKISGLSLINKDSFEKELKGYKGKNLLLLNTSEIKLSLIKDHSELAKLQIKKDLPSILEIIAYEREPSVVWRKNGVDYLLDEDGYIIREGTLESFQNYLVLCDNTDTKLEDNQPVASAKFVEFSKTTKSLLDEKKLFEKIEFFTGNSRYELTVTTPRFVLFFNTVRESSEQVESLEGVYPEVKDEVSEYIDLRVPGKVFYK